MSFQILTYTWSTGDIIHAAMGITQQLQYIGFQTLYSDIIIGSKNGKKISMWERQQDAQHTQGKVLSRHIFDNTKCLKSTQHVEVLLTNFHWVSDGTCLGGLLSAGLQFRSTL